MRSVFGKIVRSELGDDAYERYFDKLRRNRSRANEWIFKDMYHRMQGYEIGTLNHMLERLIEGIHHNLELSRQYRYIVTVFVVAMCILLFWVSEPYVRLAAMIIVSIHFAKKTIQFVVNRFCYIDANILLIYKAVLFQLILSYSHRQMSKT